MVESCSRYDAVTHLIHPIIDWSDSEVWEYIKKYRLPYPSLYDKGFKRIGCIGCPLGANQEWELEQFPIYKMAYQEAFRKMLITRSNKNLQKLRIWGNYTIDEIYNWWIGKGRKLDDPNQLSWFE